MSWIDQLVIKALVENPQGLPTITQAQYDEEAARSDIPRFMLEPYLNLLRQGIRNPQVHHEQIAWVCPTLILPPTTPLPDLAKDLKPDLETSLYSLRDLVSSMLVPESQAVDADLTRKALADCHSRLTVAKTKVDQHVDNYQSCVSDVTETISKLEAEIASLKTTQGSYSTEIQQLNSQIQELEQGMERESNRLRDIQDELNRNQKRPERIVGGILKIVVPVIGHIVVDHVLLARLNNERDGIHHRMASSRQDLASRQSQKSDAEGKLSSTRALVERIEETLTSFGAGLKEKREEQSFIVDFGVRLKAVATFVEQYHGKVDVANWSQNRNRGDINMHALIIAVRDLLNFLSQNKRKEISDLIDQDILSQMQLTFDRLAIASDDQAEF